MDRRRFLLTSLAGALAAPLAAEAQQVGKVYRLGFLAHSEPKTPEIIKIHNGLVEGLRDHGWIEGRNIVIERRYVGGMEERAAVFVAEFVQLGVDVILAGTSAGAHAAKKATSTIPIVLLGLVNPERQGLVASLARPGGNITGPSSQLGGEASGQMFQLLKDAVPKLSRVAVFWNPDNPGSALSFREGEVPAARAFGTKVISLEIRSPADLDLALATATRERPDALLAHLQMGPHRSRIVDFAAKKRLPLIGGDRLWAETGAVMSYGPDMAASWRRAAFYVDRILKGTKPGDLPIEQATRFELVINMRTAKALSLTIPPSWLLRADQLIE
jgi:putative ABC transport system substrate-binding protein